MTEGREGHEFHSCRQPLYMFGASAPEGLCLTPWRLSTAAEAARWEGVNRSGKPLRHPRAPQRLKPVEWRGLMARPKRLRENSIERGRRPPGLKPARIPGNLRGPEGPLFHGDARIREFFRNLFSRATRHPAPCGFSRCGAKSVQAEGLLGPLETCLGRSIFNLEVR
jgi:hypothetical protein